MGEPTWQRDSKAFRQSAGFTKPLPAGAHSGTVWKRAAFTALGLSIGAACLSALRELHHQMGYLGPSERRRR